jgi:hypothetical protein
MTALSKYEQRKLFESKLSAEALAARKKKLRARENAYRTKWRKEHGKEVYKAQLERAKNDPEKRKRNRAAGRKCRLGMHPEAYQFLLNQQKGVCAICGHPERIKIKGTLISLAADHCHKTGLFRGLLCRQCNTGLGNFGDDLVTVAKALKYLERFKASI